MIALLSTAKHERPGNTFIDWIRSPDGQCIPADGGFIGLAREKLAARAARLSLLVPSRYTPDHFAINGGIQTVKATAELQVIPLGRGVSVRQEIRRVVELLQGYEFIVESHASGTNIEGTLKDILAAVEQVHETLHAAGSVRLVSLLKLETRTDKTPTLAGKRL